MSKENNNIDRTFREKLLHREFAFDPSAWAGAEKLLNKDRGKGLWFFRRGFLAISTFVLTTAAILWSMNETDIYANGFANSGNQQVASINDAAPVSNSSSNPAAPGDEVIVQKDDKITSDDRSPSAVSWSESNETGVNEVVDETPVVAAAKETGVSPVEPKVKNQTKPVGQSETLSKAEVKPNSIAANKSATENSASEVISNNQYQKEGKVEEKKMLNSDQPEFLAVNTEDYLTMIQPGFETSFEKEIIQDKTELLKKEKGLLNIFASRLRVIAGAGQDFRTQQVKEDFSYSNHAFIGLSYTHPLRKQFSLQANLLYYHMGRMKVPISFDSREYDFGFNNNSQILTTKTINQLSLPLYLNYFFKGRHNLYIGGEVAFLLNAKTEMETIKEGDFVGRSVTLTTQRDIDEHLTDMRFGVVAGYEYLLQERIQLGLRYRNMGGDAFKKEYLNQNYYGSTLLITLGYNISVK